MSSACDFYHKLPTKDDRIKGLREGFHTATDKAHCDTEPEKTAPPGELNKEEKYLQLIKKVVKGYIFPAY